MKRRRHRATPPVPPFEKGGLGGIFFSLIFLVGSLFLTAAASARPLELPEDFFEPFAFRHVGPPGNRVIAVTGVAGDANVFYAGAASGGIWKTTDGGTTWAPVFDDQPAASIGALAVAPSDPNVVWAGTGETFIRANVSIGNGIYRSTDGGETWRHRGLEETGRIGRVIVHPTDPDVVWAAALGHCYGPQEARGVFRTRDGGKTWQRVLHSGPDAGASDLAIDPTNPRILYAGLWQMAITPWGRTSGGPQSGLYRSRDGGESWEKLEGSGLPDPPWGKIGVAVSRSDPRRVYALIETSSNRDFAPSDPFQGVLWRSDDGGDTWSVISADNDLVQRPLYYTRAVVAPDDRDEVYFLAVRFSRSTDGGKTVDQAVQPGYDHHDLWIDPQDPDRMIAGHDGGVSISTNGGQTWARPQLPIAQMYHVNVDRQIPYFLYGNRQDGPAVRGPSNTLDGDEIPIGAWQTVGGCEVGFAVPSPADPDVVWSGCFDGILERYDARTGHARRVSVWPLAAESWPAAELDYRFQWTYPIAISPHDPRRVYVGSQYVHLTVDEGQSWRTISPDLTTGDPELQKRTGGLTLDDAGPTVAPTIFALAESPLEPGLLWVGTNDGQVQLTRDGGATWRNVTAALPDLPPSGTVSNVEPSRHAAGTAYLTVDRHQLGDTASYVYRTTDYGASWRSLRADLPQDVFAYAHCVREDPVQPGLLYLGTENALYLSLDDGGSWRRLRAGLPPAPVHWLTIQEDFHDLVVATYGRGFWILDDVTPLRQLGRETLDGKPFLFAPRPAWRFREREPAMRQPGDPAAGKNPPYGASIHYVLPADVVPETAGTATNAPAGGAFRLAILDGTGATVRTLEEAPAEAGLNRVFWDLRYDRTREVRLLTPPAERPRFEMPEEGWRPLVDGGRFALLAPPGTYTIELRIGETVLTRELEVRKDPRSAGGEDDIAAQTALARDLRARIDQAAAMINALEDARRQLAELVPRLEERPRAAEALAAARALERELAALEGRFFDLRMTQARSDTLRWKRLLYSRLVFLAEGLTQTDHPPTDQQVAVHRLLVAELEDARRRFDALRDDVASFNRLLRRNDLDGVILDATPEAEP